MKNEDKNKKLKTQNSEENIIFRCNKCPYIPLMRILYQGCKIYIEFRCQNGHYDYEEIKTFYNRNKKCTLKELICCLNYESPSEDNKFFYCNQCEKFYCSKDMNSHSNEDDSNNNNLIPIELIDGVCKLHGEKNVYYCNKCHINICKDCLTELHSKHNYFEIKSKFYSNKQIDNYNKILKENEIKFNNFYIESQKVIEEMTEKINQCKIMFNKYKELNDYEILLCKNIINTYEDLYNKNLINYEMIFNIDNILNFKDINLEIDKNMHFLSKFQKIYSIFNNSYKSLLNMSKNYINFDLKITEKDKKFLFSKFPPLNDKKIVEYKELFDDEIQRKYYGEVYKDKYDYIKHGRGITIYDHGQKNFGYWKKDKKNGFGIVYYASGGMGIGYYENDTKIGFGKNIYVSGNKEYGYYKNGYLDGVGYLEFANGDKYIGYFNNYNFSGFGIKYNLNGDIYTGYLKNDNKNGIGIFNCGFDRKILKGLFENDQMIFGTEVFFNKEKYEGEFKYNNRNGIGITYDEENNIDFEGGFKHGLYEGFGIEYYENGVKNYEGTYKNNREDGFGKCYLKNGRLYYIGYLRNRKRNGFGIYINEKKDRLIGLWKDDQRNGYGVRKNNDGDVYKGYLIDERFYGYNEFLYNNGEKYYGEIINDEYEGYGVLFYPNGKKKEGAWLEGNLEYEINN